MQAALTVSDYLREEFDTQGFCSLQCICESALSRWWSNSLTCWRCSSFSIQMGCRSLQPGWADSLPKTSWTSLTFCLLLQGIYWKDLSFCNLPSGNYPLLCFSQSNSWKHTWVCLHKAYSHMILLLLALLVILWRFQFSKNLHFWSIGPLSGAGEP